MADPSSKGEAEKRTPRAGRVSWPLAVEEFVGRWIALPLILSVLVFGALIVAGADEEDVKRPASSFLTAILADDIVLACVRIAVLAAALYVIASVVSLATRRTWLSRVGPAETEESVAELTRERDDLSADLKEARHSIRALRGQLEEAQAALEQIRSDKMSHND